MLIWIIGISIAIVLAIVLGVYAFAANKKINDFQAKANVLENELVKSGNSWLSKLIGHFVVGNMAAQREMLTDLVERPDTEAFVTREIAKPMADHYCRIMGFKMVPADAVIVK